MFDVSVIIPAYNAEKLIDRAILSVLNQKLKPIEIIVIDDGSTDGTAEILHKYGAKIKYFYQQNSGPSVTRNRGIDESRAEWIAFLDADDEWLPHFLKTHQNILAKYPSSMWSFCNFELVGYSGKYKNSAYNIPFTEQTICYFEAKLNGIPLQTSGFLIHKSVFEKVGKFNPKLHRGEDLDLWTRIAMRYPNIAYSPTICYRYWLDNLNSLTKTEYSRDQILESIFENLELSRSLGEDITNAYYPYAKKMIKNLVFLAAARKAQISPHVLDKTKTIFQLSFPERILEATLSTLPKPIAGKLVCRLVD